MSDLVPRNALLILFILVVGFAAHAKELKKSKKQKTNDFITLLNKPRPDYSRKIRLDGVYQNITMRYLTDSVLTVIRSFLSPNNRVDPFHKARASDTNHPGNLPDPNRVVDPIFFCNNGICGEGNYSIIQEPENLPGMYGKKGLYLEWGTYEICSDTINAMYFKNYSYYWPVFEIAYFRGIIKNSNTIKDWHEVEPYHHRRTPSNPHDSYNDNMEKIPQTLTFIPCPGKTKIDSMRPWVNQYRNK